MYLELKVASSKLKSIFCQTLKCNTEEIFASFQCCSLCGVYERAESREPKSQFSGIRLNGQCHHHKTRCNGFSRYPHTSDCVVEYDARHDTQSLFRVFTGCCSILYNASVSFERKMAAAMIMCIVYDPFGLYIYLCAPKTLSQWPASTLM